LYLFGLYKFDRQKCLQLTNNQQHTKMANTSRKHNRQKRSPSGKSQTTRTAMNKARRAARTARQRAAAKDRTFSTVIVRIDGKRWAAHAKGKPVTNPKDGTLVIRPYRSQIYKHLRRLGCPACKINRNLIPSEAVRREIEKAVA
jgi:hypothetical protein